jgi:hypothetical protein
MYNLFHILMDLVCSILLRIFISISQDILVCYYIIFLGLVSIMTLHNDFANVSPSPLPSPFIFVRDHKELVIILL